MSGVGKDYELDIIKMVINQYLDENTLFTESSLNALEAKRDQVVWNMTTRIYGQSGYRVEFSLVRDIVDSRIELVKRHIAQEARRLAEQEIEEVRRATEQKAQWEAEQKVQEVRRAAIQKVQQKTEQMAREARSATESNPKILAKRKAEIFAGVRKVVGEQLAVDDEDVTLDTHLSIDFGADPLDLIEFLMAVEEEFDIEINDEDYKNHLDITHPSYTGSYFSSPSPLSSEGKAGEKAIVRNVVELVWEKSPWLWGNTTH